MDNLCHSLAGVVIAHAGLTKRFRGATALAVIGANIPDVDAAIYLVGDSVQAVAFRRGITHGVLAMIVWPLLLTAGFVALRRWSDRSDPPSWRSVLALTAMAVLSHPALDWLNVYGVRLLMPFSERWFYGDALFIVDPVLLVILGCGWWVSRGGLQRHSPPAPRPARVALALALGYILAMKGMSAATRHAALERFGIEQATARELMVAPRALAIQSRDVLVRADSTYDVYDARFTYTGATIGSRIDRLPIGGASVVATEASQTAEGREFLSWSRFPYFVAGVRGDSSAVFIGDARYARGAERTWAGVLVHVGGAQAGAQ